MSNRLANYLVPILNGARSGPFFPPDYHLSTNHPQHLRPYGSERSGRQNRPVQHDDHHGDLHHDPHSGPLAPRHGKRAVDHLRRAVRDRIGGGDWTHSGALRVHLANQRHWRADRHHFRRGVDCGLDRLAAGREDHHGQQGRLQEHDCVRRGELRDQCFSFRRGQDCGWGRQDGKSLIRGAISSSYRDFKAILICEREPRLTPLYCI